MPNLRGAIIKIVEQGLDKCLNFWKILTLFGWCILPVFENKKQVKCCQIKELYIFITNNLINFFSFFKYS